MKRSVSRSTTRSPFETEIAARVLCWIGHEHETRQSTRPGIGVGTRFQRSEIDVRERIAIHDQERPRPQKLNRVENPAARLESHRPLVRVRDAYAVVTAIAQALREVCPATTID